MLTRVHLTQSIYVCRPFRVSAAFHTVSQAPQERCPPNLACRGVFPQLFRVVWLAGLTSVCNGYSGLLRPALN